MSNTFSYEGGRGVSSLFRAYLILSSGATIPFWEAVESGIVTAGQQQDSYYTESRFLVVSVIVGGMRRFFGIDLKQAPFKLTIKNPDGNGFISWTGRLLTRDALLRKLNPGSTIYSGVTYQAHLPESTLNKILSVEQPKRKFSTGGRVLAHASI
jgi:hypothetical protein